VQFIEIVCIKPVSSPAGENKKLHYLLDYPSFSGYSVLALNPVQKSQDFTEGQAAATAWPFCFLQPEFSYMVFVQPG